MIGMSFNLYIILQFGAVLGREFSIQLLNLMNHVWVGLNEKLSMLEAMGFLHKDLGGEGLTYSFHHALARDVVYDSLLEQQKQNLHLEAVRSLISLYGKNSEQHFPSLALHAYSAGMVPEGTFYLQKCAERAKKQSSLWEAIEYQERIVKLILQRQEEAESAHLMAASLI